jgi:hypothetical protein
MGRDADIPVLLYNSPGHSGMRVLARGLSGIVAEANAAGAKHSDGELTGTWAMLASPPGCVPLPGATQPFGRHCRAAWVLSSDR